MKTKAETSYRFVDLSLQATAATVATTQVVKGPVLGDKSATVATFSIALELYPPSP